MIRWIRDWWHARQRAMDIDLLWPACMSRAKTVGEARSVFLFHCENDEAWRYIGPEATMRIVDALGKPKP